MAEYGRRFAGVKKAGGLAGIVAADSAVSTVGIDGRGLSYRGYSIEDLAANAGFEEVAWLLLRGELPSREQLGAYQARLQEARRLPPELLRAMDAIPPGDGMMGILRSSVSILGNIEPEHRGSDPLVIADKLIAALPSILLHREGKDLAESERTIAGQILHGIRGEPAPEDQRRCLDVALILYAEHEFNASTFAARVITSTLSDAYSAVAGAIGALAGPLHGGANEAAMKLIDSFADPEEAESGILVRLGLKEKIMGFGHRIYTVSDPRSVVIKEWVSRLAVTKDQKRAFDVAQRIEKVMWDEKKLFPNLDFYGALAFRFCRIPPRLYTALFVIARISGWMAHVIEQRSNNKLIRPISRYTGPDPRVYVPLVRDEKE